jgi:hypothetical protein
MTRLKTAVVLARFFLDDHGLVVVRANELEALLLLGTEFRNPGWSRSISTRCAGLRSSSQRLARFGLPVLARPFVRQAQELDRSHEFAALTVPNLKEGHFAHAAIDVFIKLVVWEWCTTTIGQCCAASCLGRGCRW